MKLRWSKKVRLRKAQKKLAFILENYGQYIHDLVKDYPHRPDLTKKDIVREAKVSRQTVINWFNAIHETEDEKWSFPELNAYKFYLVEKNKYQIIGKDIIITILQKNWDIRKDTKYLIVNYSHVVSSDIIIFITKTGKYVVPTVSIKKTRPRNNPVKSKALSDKILEPFLNRFDFIESYSQQKIPVVNTNTEREFRGVSKKGGNRHSVSIHHAGETMYLGTYKTGHKAAEVYDRAALYICPNGLQTNGIGKKPFDEDEFGNLIRKIKPIKKARNEYRGVIKYGEHQYFARIVLSGEYFNLGTYKTGYEAAEAYDRAALYFCPKVLRTNGIGTTPFGERALAELIRKTMPWKKRSA